MPGLVPGIHAFFARGVDGRDKPGHDECIYAVAPFAFARRKCSSSRGKISTKLHGR